MKNTVEFLDAVKAERSLPSDYALAQLLGITRSSVSKFRVGKDCLGDETAMKVAELLGEDPAYVVACIHAERAKRTEEKTMWARIAARIAECDRLPEKIGHLAAALAVLAVLPFVPGMEADSLSGGTDGLLGFALLAGFTSSNTVYYVKYPIWGYLVGFATAVVLLSHSSAERLRRTVSGFAAQTDRD